MNLTASWVGDGKKENPELEISGDLGRLWLTGLRDLSCISSPGIQMLLKTPELHLSEPCLLFQLQLQSLQRLFKHYWNGKNRIE